MSAEPNPLLRSALALPESQRAEIAYQLLCSLPFLGEPLSGEELERRVAAYEGGESNAAEWSEASARIQNALANLRDK